MDARLPGRFEVSSRYRSLNTMPGSLPRVLKSMSPVERRATVNAVGEVVWRVRMRSEPSVVSTWWDAVEPDLTGAGASLGMTVAGISYLWLLASVIRTRKRSLVSSLKMQLVSNNIAKI